MTSLRTPLCDLLGIDVPILSVGFGESAGLSVDAVRDVRPAAEILRDLVREAEASLAA